MAEMKDLKVRIASLETFKGSFWKWVCMVLVTAALSFLGGARLMSSQVDVSARQAIETASPWVRDKPEITKRLDKIEDKVDELTKGQSRIEGKLDSALPSGSGSRGGAP